MAEFMPYHVPEIFLVAEEGSAILYRPGAHCIVDLSFPVGVKEGIPETYRAVQ